MKNPYLIIALITLSSLIIGVLITMPPLFAQTAAHKHQHQQQSDNFTQHPINYRIANAFFPKKTLTQKNQLSAIKRYLQSNIANLAHPKVNIIQQYSKKSSIGTHYSFIQTFNGHLVYSTQIKVTVNLQNSITSVIENSYNFTDRFYENTPLPSQQLTNKFLTKAQLHITETPQASIFIDNDNTAYLVLKVVGENTNLGLYQESLLHHDGSVAYQRNLNHYYAPQTTETVTANVFLPNPITSAGVVYGLNGTYKDNNNADSDELNAEMVSVDLTLSLVDDTYHLENDFVKIINFSPPQIEPYTSTNPDFSFTRSDAAFEDVNAYYHLNAYRNYLETIGCDDLMNLQVWIDTHGENASDQSRHYFSNGQHKISFGGGDLPPNDHVDDAEDSDVIIHEYGHAIAWDACACNQGNERNAIDEGLCDYLAVSYRRAINDHNWQKVFPWDGHNEFWNGRNIASDKHYPEDNDPSSIYYTSEIWSSVLMEIWDELGREITDQLLLKSLYQYSAGMSMKTAATLLLLTDEALFDGIHINRITPYLISRGLADVLVDAGQGDTVCLGDEITLDGSYTSAPNDATIYWSPGLSLSDSTALIATANPDETTWYTLNVIDKNTNFIYKDSVFVTVNYCFDGQSLPEVINLRNTDRFAKGRGNIIVEVPENTQETLIEIFDLHGRLVHNSSYEGDDRILLAGDGFSSGLYLLRITADAETACFKVIKAR